MGSRLRVVEKIRKHALKVKKKKCEVVKEEITFLGHVVGHDKIKPDPDRKAVLFSYDKPVTLAQLWSFLGLANYHRKFIKNFADIAKPLYSLQNTKNLDKSLIKRNGGIKGEKINLVWTK